LGQHTEHLRGLLRGKVHQNQRDGLRMLVLNEVEYNLGLGALEEVKRLGPDRANNLVNYIARGLNTKGLLKGILGIIHSALYHELLSETHLVELCEHPLDHLVLILGHGRDFERDLLKLFFLEPLVYLRGVLRAYGHKHGGRLFACR
jgi:hypothetical protein